jgi:hypothetical protein
MPYQTEFSDITYPDESGRPCALKLRIAITGSSDRLDATIFLSLGANPTGNWLPHFQGAVPCRIAIMRPRPFRSSSS